MFVFLLSDVYLYTKVASVDVVAEKEIARLGGRSAHLEQLHQVVELTVHVAAHGYGRLHVYHGLLLAEEVSTFVYDLERDGLLDAALLYEVLLEHVHARLAFAVKNFGHGQKM